MLLCTWRSISEYLCRCDHPLIQEVVGDINKEIEKFCGSLLQSRKIAGDTYLFADHLSNLFGQFSQASKITRQTLIRRLMKPRMQAMEIKTELMRFRKLCIAHHDNIIEVGKIPGYNRFLKFAKA